MFVKSLCTVQGDTAPVRPMKTPASSDAIRDQYEQYGVEGYYSQFGSDYRNPHEPIIHDALRIAVGRWQLDLTQVLDLACGSGEASLILKELGASEIDGIDPFTNEAYLKRIGKPAEKFNFEQIARGSIAGRSYSLIVCSFAMHLIEESWLPALLLELGMISDRLLLLTPHKRPDLKPSWGWRLEDEFGYERIRVRIYRKA